MNLGRKKNRSKCRLKVPISSAANTVVDLQSFREALTILQRQVEELDEIRVSYYNDVLEHEEKIWDFVQGKVRSVSSQPQNSFTDTFIRFR